MPSMQLRRHISGGRCASLHGQERRGCGTPVKGAGWVGGVGGRGRRVCIQVRTGEGEGEGGAKADENGIGGTDVAADTTDKVSDATGDACRYMNCSSGGLCAESSLLEDASLRNAVEEHGGPGASLRIYLNCSPCNYSTDTRPAWSCTDNLIRCVRPLSPLSRLVDPRREMPTLNRTILYTHARLLSRPKGI